MMRKNIFRGALVMALLACAVVQERSIKAEGVTCDGICYNAKKTLTALFANQNTSNPAWYTSPYTNTPGSAAWIASVANNLNILSGYGLGGNYSTFYTQYQSIMTAWNSVSH